jgi:hypothetical protein
LGLVHLFNRYYGVPVLNVLDARDSIMKENGTVLGLMKLRLGERDINTLLK